MKRARLLPCAGLVILALLASGCGEAMPTATPMPTATTAPTATVSPTQVRVTPVAIAPTQPARRPTSLPSPSPSPTVLFVPPTPTEVPPEPTPSPTPDVCPGAVSWDQALNYVGQEITIIGPVMSTAWASESRGKPTFLNIGRAYPDPERFTVLLWIDARFRFDQPPEEMYADQTICVTGVVEIYEGGGEIIVDYPWQIVVP